MKEMHAENAQVRPAKNKQLKRLETDFECEGQEKLRKFWTSQCPDTNRYDPSIPTTPTIDSGGTPQTATKSMESFPEPCVSITLPSSQRQRSPSMACSKVLSKDPGPWDDHPTPKQAHPSNTDLSISFHPFQNTVGDSYTPTPHLSSDDQIPRYPHTGLFQQTLPDIMQDLNISRTEITILPSSSISTPL
jgi:hypothetical protein